ncbi:MAG: hypothetical protein ACRDQY_15890 [Pseudonocardiaceae bacterium]
MTSAVARSNGQQKPQLVAQTLTRPVSNYLIQVLGERAASGTNGLEIPTRVPADKLGAVLGDEPSASSGPDRPR